MRHKLIFLFSILFVLPQLTGMLAPGENLLTRAAFGPEPSGLYLIVPPNGYQQEVNQEQQGFFSISGTLINLSGGQINLDSDVMLTIYHDSQVEEVLTTPLLADQTFIFHLVPFSSDWSYVASFIHNNIEYKSQIINGFEYASAGTAPVTLWVYDSTSDKSLIRGEGMHVTLDFDQNGTVHVVESMMFVNPSSLVITPVSSKTPILMFELDGQASSLAFIDEMNSGIYRMVPGGFGDWRPILPGTVHQVMFEYDLPFNGKTDIILNLPMHMNSIVVMMEDKEDRVVCSGSQLLYTSKNPPGFVELFKGVPGSNETSLVIHCVRKWRILPFMVAGFMTVLVGLSLFVGFRLIKERKTRERSLDLENQRTQILDAIIALDDQFKAGQIPRESYNAKRSELIEKIEEKQV